MATQGSKFDRYYNDESLWLLLVLLFVAINAAPFVPFSATLLFLVVFGMTVEYLRGLSKKG